MTDTPRKTELLAAIRQSRDEWEALLARVPEARLTEPGLAGDWSVRDIVAHVTAWEEAATLRLRAAARGETPSHPIYFNQEQSIDARNAAIAARHRDQPPAEVLAASRQGHAQLLAALKALPDDKLIDRDAWTADEPLWRFIACDTYEHYAEHAATIRAWLDRQAHA